MKGADLRPNKKKEDLIMNDYERALALRDETVAHRRWMHTHAEVGLEMPKARAYVLEQLKLAGLEPRPCGHGVVAELGKEGGKTLLLRADMDALPMKEESGEPFACPSGTEAHACGHDFHTAMLLSAAKLLKESEDKLEGTVRFMFQPAEETFEGAKDMIANGILDGVDAALAYHVSTGRMPVGIFMYNDSGTMMNSVDGFKITVHGKGSHGAYPQNSIDPINIGVHIYLALEALLAHEADPNKTCVMTVGQFTAGAAANIIPDTAVLQGTIRTNDKKARALLVRRMRETAERTAAVYNATVEIRTLSEVCPLVCDKSVTDDMLRYMGALNIPNFTPYGGISATGSEDFALVAERVPSAMMYLGAGYMDERGQYTAHNPKVIFNEGVLPIGAACMAHCAVEWLKENA